MATRLEKPDSGYAWVVVFAACIINGILSGMARMIGILYVAIIETYGVSRKEASLPFTVRNAIRYLSGPLVGILGQRYGIRSVTFAGGIIAALGSVLCCVAPTVTWISVFWGGVHGLGFSLANTLFQVVVNQYFVRHRATASGIVLSGACFGSLVFPLMLGGLLDEYGLVGCFLVLGGLFLNVSPPALVLRVPPWIENPEEYARKKALLERLSEAEADTTGYRNINKVSENRKNYSRSLSNCSISEFDVHHLSHASSKTLINKFGGPNSKKLKFNRELNESKVEVNVICTSYCAINTALRIDANEQEFNRAQDIGTNEKLNVSTNFGTQNNSTNFKTEPKDGRKNSDSKSLLGIAKNIFLLYKNPIYVLISICVATYFWVFISILTVVVDFSMDKGIEERDTIYLIHSLNIGDLLGRLCFGWVTDKSVLSFPSFLCLVFVLQGVFVALLPLVPTPWLFGAALALYGVCAGVVFVQFPVLVHEYVEEENQPVAMGCVGLVSGVATFGIPSLIGYFRDQIGSYNGLLYFIALLSILTGVLWLFEPCFYKGKRRSKECY